MSTDQTDDSEIHIPQLSLFEEYNNTKQTPERVKSDIEELFDEQYDDWDWEDDYDTWELVDGQFRVEGDDVSITFYDQDGGVNAYVEHAEGSAESDPVLWYVRQSFTRIGH